MHGHSAHAVCGLLRRLSRWRLALALLAALAATVWFGRTALVSWALRGELARRGLGDVSFRLTRLSAGAVAAEAVRLGPAGRPLLEIGQAEARYSVPELLRGTLSQLRVTGVRVPAVLEAEGRALRVPLLERLSGLAPVSPAGRPSATPPLRVGELSVFDLSVPVRLSDGAELFSFAASGGLVAEPASVKPGVAPEARYRLWADAAGDAGLRGTLSGRVAPRTGDIQLSVDFRVKRVEEAASLLRRAAPRLAAGWPAYPTNVSFALRGSLAVSAWTNAGPFDVTAELGRGSVFTLSRPEGWVRFQTLRLEASGTPRDVQTRLSVGIAGLRVGGQLQASQEEGRLLSMRGTGRYVQTATNRLVRATLDSDMPGKSLAQVLPTVLPLLGRLLTEGGTLRGEADLSQPSGGSWQGALKLTAEARRNALSLPAGRVGAGRVAVEGRLDVRDGVPGALSTDIRVEEGYFFRPGLSLRAGGALALRSQPPYRSAAGTLDARVSEGASAVVSGLPLPPDGLRISGSASVDGLVTAAVWRVALKIPEYELAAAAGGGTSRATAGAAAELRYGAPRLSLDGEVWTRDAAASVTRSGAVGRVEAGFGRVAASVSLRDADLSQPSNVVVSVTVSASNAWARASERVALEGAALRVPFSWSLAQGLSFGEQPDLGWRRLEAEGVRLVPETLSLRAAGGVAEAAWGARAEGSRFRAEVRARVPLDAPGQSVIDVAVPELELAPDDALAAWVRRAGGNVAVSGRAAAEAKIGFLGSRPQVRGRVRLAEAAVRRDRLEVSGLGADAEFEAGLGFRTIGRPVVTFKQVKAGNIRLDQGRVEFQVTPEEVFMDRLEVGWCKGQLRAYSVHLDPRNPKADVIVYADRIDLGEALMMVMPFKGRMEGVLYGRFPVGIEGRRVKLSTGYLFSLPGQGGVLRLEDSAQMEALLDRAGIAGEVRQPLSKALSDMDFSAIRMELEPKPDGEAVFRIKLDGKSNFKEWPAPVALNLNLHGPLEELLNLGLSVSRK